MKNRTQISILILCFCTMLNSIYANALITQIVGFVGTGVAAMLILVGFGGKE